MAKKRAKKRSIPPPPSPASRVGAAPGEDRRSVAVTVAWMMTTLATAVGLGLYALASLAVGNQPVDAEDVQPWQLFPAAALFTTLVTSVVTWFLTPFVYRFRPVPPPRAVTAVTLGIAALPWIILLVAK